MALNLASNSRFSIFSPKAKSLSSLRAGIRTICIHFLQGEGLHPSSWVLRDSLEVFFGVAMEFFEDASPFTEPRGPKTAEWKRMLQDSEVNGPLWWHHLRSD